MFLFHTLLTNKNSRTNLSGSSPSVITSAGSLSAVVAEDPEPAVDGDEPDISCCSWLLMMLATRARRLLRRRISWKRGVVTVENESPFRALLLLLLGVVLVVEPPGALWSLLLSCELMTKKGVGLGAPRSSSSSLISIGRLSMRRSMGRTRASELPLALASFADG